MKKMKKLLSMLLAVVMVLAMAAPSFAAPLDGYSAEDEKGTIKIDNPKDGVTYTAYKIFDLTYLTKTENETTKKDGYIYTINSKINSMNNPWYMKLTENVTVDDKEVTNAEKLGITLTEKVENGIGTGIYEITIDDAVFDAATFATTLKEVLTTKDTDDKIVPNTVVITQLKNAGNGHELVQTEANTGIKYVNDLDLGYYFVDNTNGGLCNLNSTVPQITIHDKNDIIFDKTDNKVGVNIGDSVDYVIKSEIPDTTGFKKFYDYVITDEMSEGLTLNRDVSVKINNAELDAKYKKISYTEVKTGETPNETVRCNGFKLEISILDLVNDEICKFGDPIAITYSAIVNEKAISKVEYNTATLNYSNNPNEKDSKGTITDTEDVYSISIEVDKYIGENKNDKLAGAEFVLRRTVDPDTNKETVNYYKENDDKSITWVSELKEATIKRTDDNGSASFNGISKENLDADNETRLENIKYELVEVKAPAGYNLLTTPVEVLLKKYKKVDGQDVVIDPLEKEDGIYTNKDAIANKTLLTFPSEVSNNRGTILPSTGGIGTTIFYAAGIILMAGAVFFVVRRKKA